MAHPSLFGPIRLGLVAAFLLAGGCGNDGDFPLLELRSAESEDPREEPGRTPPRVESDPALRARAAELAAEARRGEQAFAAAFGPAAAAARAARAPGSESWIEAQQAISRAEASRAATTGALAELDRLAAERAAAPTNAADFAAIRAALDEVAALAAGQQRRLDGLRAAVRR